MDMVRTGGAPHHHYYARFVPLLHSLTKSLIGYHNHVRTTANHVHIIPNHVHITINHIHITDNHVYMLSPLLVTAS